MKKSIFVVAAVLAGSITFAQKKEKQSPPPPPPPVMNVNEVPPPPPPPPVPSKQTDWNNDNAFLKHNPTVKSIGWSENKIRVHLKSGREEVYNLDNKEEMENFKKQYGELPVAPPPPPAPKAPKLKHITES